jgi:hypothetical protein
MADFNWGSYFVTRQPAPAPRLLGLCPLGASRGGAFSMTGVIWGIAIPTIWAFTLVVAYWLGRVDSWESHRVTHELDLTLLSRTKDR